MELIRLLKKRIKDREFIKEAEKTAKLPGVELLRGYINETSGERFADFKIRIDTSRWEESEYHNRCRKALEEGHGYIR